MRWALLWFLSTTGVVIVALCLMILFLRSRIRRMHRVDPSIATTAPFTWLVDPRSPARLHRRLAAIGRLAAQVARDHGQTKRFARRNPEPTPLQAGAITLLATAVNLDHQLSRIAMLTPQARKAPLAQLAQAVSDLEKAAVQLEKVSAEVLAPPVLNTENDDITNIRAQLDRLAAAHKALNEIDQSNGLSEGQTRPAMGSS